MEREEGIGKRRHERGEVRKETEGEVKKGEDIGGGKVEMKKRK